MRGKPKRAARIDRHDLIGAVAKEEAAVKGRDARSLKRQELAVHIADGQRLGHVVARGSWVI